MSRGTKRSTQQVRDAWGQPCGALPLVVLQLHSGAKLTVRKEAQEAFRALDYVMQAHGYSPRAGDTGGYNCRAVTGGRAHSLHAYALAGDYNWNTNPFRRDRLVTDMPEPMVDAIYRIRTKGGDPVFRSGIDWGTGRPTKPYDAMHWEINASPAELAKRIDWSTVQLPAMNALDPHTFPVVQEGERGPAVLVLQDRLGIHTDGIAGANTAGAIRSFQAQRALKVDGVFGLQSWTALLTAQPVVQPGEPSPVKIETAGVCACCGRPLQ